MSRDRQKRPDHPLTPEPWGSLTGERAMDIESAVEQAYEAIASAKINLDNMVKMMPALAAHPLLPLVKEQVQAAMDALDEVD